MKNLLALFLLSAASSLCATTATSPVFGTYSVECMAECDTYISIPTTRTPEFSGIVKERVPATFEIVAEGTPNWVANKFVYAQGVQPNHYYLKFTSGELEGAWFDISSNASHSLVIEIGAGELSKVSVGDSFEIIPHWTLATLFPNGGNFTKSTAVAAGVGASKLYKYTNFSNDGVEYPVGINRVPLSSYYFRQRGGDIAWKDANRNNANDDVIEPNAVLFVRQPENKDIVAAFNGVIPMCATSFELFTMDDGEEVPSQDIYLAVPAAVDLKLADLNECLIDSGAFKASTAVAARPEDALYIYSNEGFGINLLPDVSCYYRKRGSTDNWLDADRNNANNVTLKAGTVLMFRKKSDGIASSVRCKFKPNYIQ